MNKEHGVLDYFGTAWRWPFLCLMRKIKPGRVATALFAHCPVVIMAVVWQIEHADRTRKGDVHFSQTYDSVQRLFSLISW